MVALGLLFGGGLLGVGRTCISIRRRLSPLNGESPVILRPRLVTKCTVLLVLGLVRMVQDVFVQPRHFHVRKISTGRSTTVPQVFLDGW